MSALHYQSPESLPVVPVRKPQSRAKKVRATASAVVTPIFDAVPVSLPKGRASRKTFTLFIVGIFTFGLLLTLQVQVMAGSASFQKHELEIQLSDLSAQRQALESDVAIGEAPDQLMTKARKLGMVPAAAPVFIRLSDQKILGKPLPAEARTFK